MSSRPVIARLREAGGAEARALLVDEGNHRQRVAARRAGLEQRGRGLSAHTTPSAPS